MLKFLLLSVLALLAPLEGGGVMLVAHRNGMAVWTNPYVTDGLVAMWDGEWNAGGGVHDSSATVWKDLSGDGYDGTFVGTIGTDFEWASDAFVRKAYGSRGGWSDVDISDRMISAAKSATFTVEVVTGAPVGSNTWQSQIFNLCQIGQGYNHGISLFFRKEGNGEVAGVYTATYSTNGSATISPYDAKASVSFVVDGANTVWMLNNVQKGTKTISPDGTISSVYARLGSSNYAYTGRYMNYRIYSRALTAAEISANYAIDKARFNLP